MLLPKPTSKKGKHSTRAKGDAGEAWICARLDSLGIAYHQGKQTADGFKREDITTRLFLLESKATPLPARMEAYLDQADNYSGTIYQGKLMPVVVVQEHNQARAYMDFEVFLDILHKLERS
jgi:hypothetical protein